MLWLIFGGIGVALVVIDWARHFYYVAKNVWAMRYAFSKPVRVLPSPGVVTLNGLVSAIGDNNRPVKVILQEDGERHRGQIYGEQTLRTVKVQPFELILPEIGAKVIVEPGENVLLRSLASTTEWKRNAKIDKLRRKRIGAVEAGERALVTGVLSEKRETEIVATEYRSQKGQTRIEYVLRPLPDEPMRIDSETMLDEIEECRGHGVWLLTLGAIVVPSFYVQGVLEKTLDRNPYAFGWIAFAYAVLRLFAEGAKRERRCWFDRPNKPGERYRFVEDR